MEKITFFCHLKKKKIHILVGGKSMNVLNLFSYGTHHKNYQSMKPYVVSFGNFYFKCMLYNEFVS